jgi:toxin-antitoxin system PIN domain toxin
VSFAVDVNVLVSASHAASPVQGAARLFLERRCAGPEVVFLAWITVASYLRVITDPRILGAPLSPAEALANLRALLERPNWRTLAEKEGFLDAYERVTAGPPVRGKLVPDAHLATILYQHGVRTLYTADRDFRRFDFLDVRDPHAH